MDEMSDVIGRADAIEKGMMKGEGFGVGGLLARDLTRGHAIDVDAERPEFLGKALGGREDRALGSGVVHASSKSLHADGGTNIDDLAGLGGDHVLGDGVNAVERAEEVDADNVSDDVQLLLMEDFHAAAGATAGAIDEYIDAPMAGVDVVHGAADCFGVGNVEPNGFGFAAESCNGFNVLPGKLSTDVEEHDFGAFGGEFSGDGASEDAATTSNNGNLVFKFHSQILCFCEVR